MAAVGFKGTSRGKFDAKIDLKDQSASTRSRVQAFARSRLEPPSEGLKFVGTRWTGRLERCRSDETPDRHSKSTWERFTT